MKTQFAVAWAKCLDGSVSYGMIHQQGAIHVDEFHPMLRKSRRLVARESERYKNSVVTEIKNEQGIIVRVRCDIYGKEMGRDFFECNMFQLPGRVQ